MCISLSSLMFGSAATAATATTAATAATAGMFGVGGAFSLGQALLTTGSLLSASSAISGGNQQAAQAEWQAKQAAADAQAEREASQVRAEKVRKAGKQQQSQAKAALAASGVETGAGTAVKIVQQIGQNAEEDAQSELLSGNSKSSRLYSESVGYNEAASNSRNSGFLRAGGSLATGAASLWKARA